MLETATTTTHMRYKTNQITPANKHKTTHRKPLQIMHINQAVLLLVKTISRLSHTTFGLVLEISRD